MSRDEWDGGPGDPRLDPADQVRLEEQLRRALAAQATQAPDATALTERLLAAGSSPDLTRSRRGWTTWATPLVAAACVLALVGLLFALTGPGRHRGHSDQAGRTIAPPPAPASTAGSVAATSAPATDLFTAPSVAAAAGQGTSLTGVRIVDLTFTGTDVGWALASADCLKALARRCTALLHTTDGHTWTAPSGLESPFTVEGVDGCPASTCVEHLRFKDDSTGYAFGPHALFVTNDGGLTWTPQAGGADDLEILNNTAIRVSALEGTPSLQVSAAGGSVWTSKSTAGFPPHPTAVTLSRAGRTAVIALSQLDSPNGSDPRGVLLRSGDDGASWTPSSTDPCAATAATDALVTATTAVDGSVVLGCDTQAAQAASQRRGRVLVSTDGGSAFAAAPAGRTAPVQVLGAASATVIVAVPSGNGSVSRSTDGGATWSPIATLPATTYRFLGFENATVGRLVSADGRTVWTTRDAGASWTEVSF